MKIHYMMLAAALCGMPVQSHADTLMIINNELVIVDQMVEPDPHSMCEQEKAAAPLFYQTLNIMLSADVSMMKIGEDARGIPVVRLIDRISGKDVLDILVQENLAKTHHNPLWCK
jgi:hypothetical protein